jgi:GNAT superfamily N-acetyltransferase
MLCHFWGRRRIIEEITIANLLNTKHADAVLFLLNEYAKDEMGGGAELSNFVKENLILSLSHRHGVHIILAFVNGKAAGIANCFEGFSTFSCKPLLNIHDFAIALEFRGRGLAKRLMGRVEEVARALDCCKITLEVLEGNMVAQAAYKACGFAGYELDPNMGRAMFWQKKL